MNNKSIFRRTNKKFYNYKVYNIFPYIVINIFITDNNIY